VPNINNNGVEKMKIKAIVFPAVNKYEFRTLTLNEIGPTDVLVKTLTTAISPGTERWTLRGKHLGTAFPCVPGYHRIGIVEKCGSEVKTLEVGDIVYGSANNWQEDCLSMFGAHVDYSIGDAAGYIFLSAKMMSKFELETVCFTILASVAQRGIEELTLRKGNKMVMIGSGIIGLVATQLAARQGVSTTLLDIDPRMHDFVKKNFPENEITSPLEENWVEKLQAIAPQGFDYLYDSVGHAETTNEIIKLMHQQGEMMMQAQYFDREKCAIDLDMTKIKELVIKSTCGSSPWAMRTTIDQITNREIQIAPMITHRFKAEDALKGYELLDKNLDFNLGIVFDWQ
jgi:bacteriochlorophyllide a dehydrogenase